MLSSLQHEGKGEEAGCPYELLSQNQANQVNRQPELSIMYKIS